MCASERVGSSFHGGAKQTALVVTFVIIITKGYKLRLHRAVNTSQSSQGVILMYCVFKKSVTNFRSTNSIRYELAFVSVAQYNTASYKLLNSVNHLVVENKLIIAQGNSAIIKESTKLERVSVNFMLFFVYWEHCTTKLNRQGVSVLYIQFIDISSDRVI